MRTHQWLTSGPDLLLVEEYKGPARPRATLLFVHGRFGDGETWWPVIALLRQQFRCLVFHLPGFGRSHAREGEAFSVIRAGTLVSMVAARLVHEPLFLVGHDVGGAVCQLATLFGHHRIDGLALLNACCASDSLAPLRAGPAGYSLRRRLRRMLKKSRRLDHHQRKRVEESWQVRRPGDWLNLMRQVDASWPREAQRRLCKEALARMETPLLLLWGTEDSINPADRAYDLIRRVPSVTYHEASDCGHWALLERPEWVAKRMKDFIYHQLLHGRTELAALHPKAKLG